MRALLMAAGALGASLIALSGVASGAPLNGAAARVFAGNTALVEQVQYRRHRMTRAERERYTRIWFSRQRVMQEPDGTILLPGIRTGYGGITTVTGAPRTRYSNPQRIGVWRTGPSGRLTGGVPRVGGRH